MFNMRPYYDTFASFLKLNAGYNLLGQFIIGDNMQYNAK